MTATNNYLNMKKIKIEIQISTVDTPAELPAPERALLEKAAGALHHSYAPYSGFRVGAAARLGNGEMVAGANLENASYPMCTCAEQAVLSTVNGQHPGQLITCLAVTVKSRNGTVDRPVSPCGSCRQIICEFEERQQAPIAILLRGETGPIYRLEKGQDLLPLSFNGSYL